LDKVFFPYRSSSHTILLHVVAESGAWEKHGLDVEFNRQISSEESHRAIAAGDIEFVGGNHVSTYGHRARGDGWVYLGQTVNQVNHRLVVRADGGIDAIADLRGKKVGSYGTHPNLNTWLYLKQRGLDLDRDDYEFVSQSVFKPGTMDEIESELKHPPLWHWVRDGVVDAALLSPPASLFAKAAGLKVIDVEPLAMIQYTTVSTSLKFVEKHPKIVERFLKGLIEGIHFFKTEPEASIRIIQREYTKAGQMNAEQARYTWESLAQILEPKLYPSLRAIANVYEEALRHDKDARRVNPMELWALHHIRLLDDSGFVDHLYGTRGDTDRPRRHDMADATLPEDVEKITASQAAGHTDCEETCN
jgi:ABC-type nitrate/sulfonate/bicarbonate transport system substrate-binding protein